MMKEKENAKLSQMRHHGVEKKVENRHSWGRGLGKPSISKLDPDLRPYLESQWLVEHIQDKNSQ